MKIEEDDLLHGLRNRPLAARPATPSGTKRRVGARNVSNKDGVIKMIADNGLTSFHISM